MKAGLMYKLHLSKRTADVGRYSYCFVTCEHSALRQGSIRLSYYEDFINYKNSFHRVTSRAANPDCAAWEHFSYFDHSPAAFDDILTWLYQAIRPVNGAFKPIGIQSIIRFILEVGTLLGVYTDEKLPEFIRVVDHSSRSFGRYSRKHGEVVAEQLKQCGGLAYKYFGPHLGYTK